MIILSGVLNFMKESEAGQAIGGGIGWSEGIKEPDID
jgi:hypothetical protein